MRLEFECLHEMEEEIETQESQLAAVNASSILFGEIPIAGEVGGLWMLI